MKVRLKYNKRGMIKYISHLDTMRLFQRTFRRTNVPVLFSQGFNPHMLMSLANPLPLGVESDIEYLDFEIDYSGDLNDLITQINSGLPEGIKVYDAIETDGKSINEKIKWSKYEFDYLNENKIEKDVVEKSILNIINSEEIIIEKRKKVKGKKVFINQDVREFIKDIKLIDFFEGGFKIEATLKSSSDGGLNPIEFTKLFNKYSNATNDINSVSTLRKEQYNEEMKNSF